MLHKLKETLHNLLPKYAVFPLILALVINNCVYIGAAQLRDSLTFHSLETPLDRAIPLLTPFILFYIFAYVQWGINYIFIGRDSKTLCYQFVFADILSKIICLFFFIFSQLVSFIYTIDAPVNLFPSIHCLESWCCIRAAFKMNFKNRTNTYIYRTATIVMSLGVFASTLFIKQHVLLDIFGGIAAFEAGLKLSKIMKHN